MAEKWHDINAPGVWQKPDKDKPAPESNKPSDAADDPPPEPQKPLVKLSEGKFVPPDEGVEINKKCQSRSVSNTSTIPPNQCKRSPSAFIQIIKTPPAI